MLNTSPPSVIQTFTKSKTKGAGKRAEMILDRLHEHQEEENPAVGPDARSFNLLIAYYGKSKEPDAPYRAEYLLNRMISRFKYGQSDLVPSQFAITTVIDSYSFAGHPDAGRNADRLLKLLRQLKQEYGASKLIVNTAVMNSVLGAWANCGDENAGQRAENYLDEMEASFKKGAIHMQPDTKSYGLVLSAWSKSTSTDKFRRALTVLRRMEQQHKNGNQHVCVDEHARSLVINTCGFSNADTKAEFEAFDIAITIFDEMVGTDRDRPTSLSFGWFIQAMGRLRVDEEKKSAQIANAFNMCCEAGRVNEFVLHRLKGAASDSLYKHLLEPVGATRSDKKPTWLHLARLPLEWKRNASNWPRNSR